MLGFLKLRICLNCQKYRKLYSDMSSVGLGVRWYGEGRCQVAPFRASMRKPTDYCEMFMEKTDGKTFRCYEDWGFATKDLKELKKEVMDHAHRETD